VKCAHDAAKRSARAFLAGTVRLPHMPDREAVQTLGGLTLHMRNCPHCGTTLTRRVRRARIAKVAARVAA
jgi:hypothetical protein